MRDVIPSFPDLSFSCRSALLESKDEFAWTRAVDPFFSILTFTRDERYEQ